MSIEVQKYLIMRHHYHSRHDHFWRSQMWHFPINSYTIANVNGNVQQTIFCTIFSFKERCILPVNCLQIHLLNRQQIAFCSVSKAVLLTICQQQLFVSVDVHILIVYFVEFAECSDTLLRQKVKKEEEEELDAKELNSDESLLWVRLIAAFEPF